MDEAFKAIVRDQMGQLRADISRELQDMRMQVEGIRGEVNRQVEGLKKDMNGMREDVNRMKEDVQQQMADMKKDMEETKREMYQQLTDTSAKTQENIGGLRNQIADSLESQREGRHMGMAQVEQQRELMKYQRGAVESTEKFRSFVDERFNEIMRGQDVLRKMLEVASYNARKF